MLITKPFSLLVCVKHTETRSDQLDPPAPLPRACGDLPSAAFPGFEGCKLTLPSRVLLCCSALLSGHLPSCVRPHNSASATSDVGGCASRTWSGSGSGCGRLGNQPQQHGAAEVLTNWLVSADKLPRPLTSYITVMCHSRPQGQLLTR